MRRLLLCTLLLLALFLAALGNAASVADHVERWCEGLGRAEAAAADGDWEEAEAALGEVYERWSEQQRRLHILVKHEELDAAEALFARAFADARSRETAALLADGAELRGQLRLLREMEEFSVKNIL